MADITKLYCLLTKGQTISTSTVLCEEHYTVENVKKTVHTLDDPEVENRDAWFECTGHPVHCVMCPPLSLGERILLGAVDAKPELKAIFAAKLKELEEMVEYYGMHDEVVPDRIVNFMSQVLWAPNLEEARDIAQKAWKKMESHCLAAWSNGKADGANSIPALMKRAKKYEGYAERLEKQAKDGKEELEESRKKKAAAHRETARELREQVARLQGQRLPTGVTREQA